MKHLDLFSGIGGFALAARWLGWQTVAFCEIEPYCQKVLAKHWPGVPIYDDIKTLTAQRLAADGIGCDLLTAGFPCQDISVAGKGAGIDGKQSGLWSELARIIGEIRPRYAVMENVSALLGRGLERVAGDLAEIWYDCEWHCIPASAIGAPHRRDRVWIIAYPCSDQLRHQPGWRNEQSRSDQAITRNDGAKGSVADTDSEGLAKRFLTENRFRNLRQEGETFTESGWWTTEPDVGRVAHGIPKRVDKLRGLGNAIVPQVAELIFRAIEETEKP